MKPIIKWTLKQRKVSIIWWSVGVAVFLAINLAFYPSVRDQAAELNRSFEQMPDTLKAFISDTSDFLSPEGYLSSQVFYLMLPLLLGVLAIGLGSKLLAKEENDTTIELLLSRPISRGRLLAAKGLAGLLIVAIVSLVALAVTVMLSWLVDIEVPLSRIAAATLLSMIFGVLLGAVAFFVTAIGRRSRLSAVGAAAFVAVGGYIITSLVSVADWLKWPAKAFPYNYYKPGEVLYGTYDWWQAGLFLAVIAALALLSFISFRRRDIG